MHRGTDMKYTGNKFDGYLIYIRYKNETNMYEINMV